MSKSTAIDAILSTVNAYIHSQADLGVYEIQKNRFRVELFTSIFTTRPSSSPSGNLYLDFSKDEEESKITVKHFFSFSKDGKIGLVFLPLISFTALFLSLYSLFSLDIDLSNDTLKLVIFALLFFIICLTFLLVFGVLIADRHTVKVAQQRILNLLENFDNVILMQAHSVKEFQKD